MGIKTIHIELEKGGQMRIPHREHKTGRDDRIGEHFTTVRVPKSEKVAHQRFMEDQLFNTVINAAATNQEMAPENILREYAGKEVCAANLSIGINPREVNRRELERLKREKEERDKFESYYHRFKELIT